jgi:glutaredoxin
MNIKHVDGEDRGKVMVYALSTCGWCKKTKTLLNDMNVEYDYADVDLLNANDRESALDIIRKWNPSCSFPSVVINDAQCIVGYDEKKIREVLGK